MAQINTQMPDLSQFFGGNAAGMQLGLEQRAQAMQGNDINQQQALQDMFQSGEKHPLEMQGLRDRSAAAGAQLPGIVADSSMKGMEASDMAGLGDVFRQDVQRGKGQGVIAAGKEKEFAHKAMELYASGDPVKQKQATQMFHALEAHETIKQQAIQERALALENQRHKNAMERDKEFGRFRSAAGGSATKDPYIEMLSKGKLKEAYTYQAMKESEPEAKAAWLAAAKAAEEQQIALENAKADAAAARSGNIDISGASGQPRPSVPPPVRSPIPTVPSGTNKGSLGPGTIAPGGPTVATPKITNIEDAKKAGWKLMTDKNGNKAYVSPDKTQHIESK